MRERLSEKKCERNMSRYADGSVKDIGEDELIDKCLALWIDIQIVRYRDG